jgi:hypothetical protein
VRKISAIAFTITVFSTIASAQLPSSGNVFFGYSYVHGETFANSATVSAANGGTSMSGWEGTGEGKFLPWLSGVVDFDWHYGGKSASVCTPLPCHTFRLNGSRNTVLFGPRAFISYGRYRPFAEFLLGFGRQSDAGGNISNSDLTFAYALGGGVDYSLLKSVALRGELDSVHTSFFGGTQNDLRISTGIVFHF